MWYLPTTRPMTSDAGTGPKCLESRLAPALSPSTRNAVLERHDPLDEVAVRFDGVPQGDDVADGHLVGLADDHAVTGRQLGDHREAVDLQPGVHAAADHNNKCRGRGHRERCERLDTPRPGEPSRRPGGGAPGIR